ncbi:MAG: hypothetical protein RLZZ175_2320 [Bacteroidota bacterium]|jgi:cytochrome c oxidase assembly protein subunit 15
MFELIDKKQKPVVYWLIIGIVMIIIQIMLGAITRLTGSGLSITEWKLIMGTLPPLNETEWQTAFEQYQKIGQFKQLNNYFNLSDFKFIFFWEWSHRFWARMIGFVFAIPFVIFLIQKRFNKNQILPLIILFFLGGLQGAIGWIMVKSGINETSLYVDHIKLAAHFISALVLLVYTIYFLIGFIKTKYEISLSVNQNKVLLVMIILLTIQLVYGAFMAGIHAGPTAPTWPTINGNWFPYGGEELGLLKWTHNAINIQFVHRTLAYILCAFSIYWWVLANKEKLSLNWAQHLPLAIIILQTILGIITVLMSPYQKILLVLGTMHQFVGMVFCIILMSIWFLRKVKYQINK